MLTFSRNALSVLAMLSGLGLSNPAFGLDASKLITPETKSSTVIELFVGYVNEGKREDAVEVLRYAAEQGNSAAQWKLAHIYESGDQGIERDPLQAFKMFHRIAQKYSIARPNTASWQFSADALVKLGNYYRQGIPGTHIKSDPSQAFVMYTTAAMVFRHPDAQFQLGRMQINNEKRFGQGRLGVRNLALAHKKGHVGAEALLGYSHFEGIHTRYDPVRGLTMLKSALSRANTRDKVWIQQLHDEAFALAHPKDRAKVLELTSAKIRERR